MPLLSVVRVPGACTLARSVVIVVIVMMVVVRFLVRRVRKPLSTMVRVTAEPPTLILSVLMMMFGRSARCKRHL